MRAYRPCLGRLIAAAVLISALPPEAVAHVKWFAPYDIATTPRALLDVSSSAFWLLVGSSLIVMWTACKVELTTFGAALLRAADGISVALRARTEDLLRAATAAFFIAIGVAGNIILTPDLKTDSATISWLQFAIALGMFWRSTLVLSSIGMVVLYAIAIANYGVFHMMDYPIFLGV